MTWLAQTLAVMRLELKKTFLARRGLWVYLLAWAPVLLFALYLFVGPHRQDRLARLAREHPASTSALRSLETGDSLQEVQRIGEAYQWRSGRFQIDGVRGDTLARFTDGHVDALILLESQKVTLVRRTEPDSLTQGTLIFATSFQTYFLRLAVFFGCVGVFVNLVRGEMLDKTLHYYLLTPVRRECLIAGKYLAGLLATVAIFITSAIAQMLLLFCRFDHASVAEYLAGSGWTEVFSYLGITALACIGYGSVFLAAGLFFRNPLIPTAIVLVWESSNVFLPEILRKASLLYYLQSLCPVAVPADTAMPALWRLLVSNVAPASPATAIGGILVLTALILVFASRRARTLEINYTID